MILQLRFFIAVFTAVALVSLSAVAQDAAPAASNAAAGKSTTKNDSAARNATAKKDVESAAAPVVFAKPDPAVDTIVDSNPTTPAQLLQAAALLADLDRVDLAKKYLQQLAAAKPDENALAEAAGQVQPATLLRLADNADLQPEGRQLADAVLAAAAHLARDPARLQAEIEHLADPSLSVQRAALKRILAAHDDAVPALVSALGDANRAAVHPLVKEVLVNLGAQAVAPLGVALETDNESLKVQIIDVLRQIGSRNAVAYLAAPATAANSSSEVRAAACAALNEIVGAKNPSPEDAAKLLTAEIERYLKHDHPLKFDAAGNAEVWHWDPASGTVVKEALPPEIAFPTLAARLADDLIELSPHDLVAQRLFLISTLQAAALRAGLDQPLPHNDAAVAKAAQLGPAAMEDALVYAMSNEKLPAATAAAQILGNIGDRSLLEIRDGRFSPLAQAVGQGNRRLRFAAAEAIMKLKPAGPFGGSSDLVSALAFFADSPGTKRALVAHPNAAVAGQLAGMLTGMGYEVDTVANGRQAYLQAISSGDYEVVLLSSRLDHPPVWVALAELRHDPRTAHAPIGLVAEDSEDDLARMQTLALDNEGAMAFPRPITPEGMKFEVERLIDHAGSAVVPEDVRLRQALAAAGWLRQLHEASPRDFDLLAYEAQLTRMLFQPATSAAAAEMLASIGKQAAQESLVELANTVSQPLAMRQAAAAAFSQAVRKHSILLTAAEIQHQYDRYNQSAGEDQPTQQLLGLILDAIELPTAAKK
jgi:CheY-like chemotaxis protein